MVKICPKLQGVPHFFLPPPCFHPVLLPALCLPALAPEVFQYTQEDTSLPALRTSVLLIIPSR